MPEGYGRIRGTILLIAFLIAFLLSFLYMCRTNYNKLFCKYAGTEPMQSSFGVDFMLYVFFLATDVCLDTFQRVNGLEILYSTASQTHAGYYFCNS